MTSHVANYPNQPARSEEMLDALQRDDFGYFMHETNPANGLVADKTRSNAPASIAARNAAAYAYARQSIHDRIVEHKQHVTAHGQEMPDIRNWK